MHIMSTIVMDNSNISSSTTSNSRTSQNLAMINDSGGPMASVDGMMMNNSSSSGHEVENFQQHAGPGSADLIATALDAANICAQDSLDVVNTVIETSAGGAGSAPVMEEGIIYRNPSTTPNTSTGNSKVHFISNLTLVPKHQQQQQHQTHHNQHQPPRTGQNIIFLNNNNSSSSNSGASLVAAKGSTTNTTGMSSVAATNYINAFVSGKAGGGGGGATTTTTTGKVVNLLHATGSKSAVTTVSGQSLIPQQQQQQQRMVKSVQVLKRLPVQQQQQQSNVIGRTGLVNAGQLHLQQTVTNKVGGALQTQKPQNVVISGSSLLGGGSFKTLNSGKLVNAGLYNNNPNNSTTTATMKMVNNGQQQQQPQQVQHKAAMAKYTKGGVLAATTSKMKNAAQLSKYQPKVVQVQQANSVASGGNYSTVASGGGGPTQWRVDMRGGRGGGMHVTPAGEEVVIGGGEISGIVHRPAIQGGGSGGVISVQGSSPTKVITMNSNNKYTVQQQQQQQPMLMMSGGGVGGVGKAITGNSNNYATHTVQMSSPGQYSVIGGEEGQQQQQQQQQGTIKYVNAQGNVVQQQQQQQQAGKYKVESSDHHHNHQQVHNVIQFGSGGGKKHPKQAQTEEIYYVNGTQMNDVMSARLLHSFSQKATSRYAAAHAPNAGFAGVGQGQAAGSGNPGGAGVNYQYSAQGNYEGPSGYHQQQQQTSGLQQGSAAGSSGGVQQKHGPEYFRVNTSDLQTTTTTTTTTFFDNIPLTSRLEDKDGNNNGSASSGVVLLGGGGSSYLGHSMAGGEEPDQEDIMGVEMRPAPISSSLHAVLQDHTYVLLQRPGEQKPGNSMAPGQSSSSSSQYVPGSQLDNKELGIAMALAEAGNGTLFQRQQHHHQQQQQVKCTTTDLLNAAMGLGHYPLPSGGQLDDDNCSVISNDSRCGKAGENDLGEETETAPEGDGEDDSVTRCICDLTHDDGYMICCDKCSTWQHVDCMGIDRLNIPDEYNCDVCQPRPMDKNRARTLQLLKRREQQNAALMHSMALSNGGLQIGAGGPVVMGGQATAGGGGIGLYGNVPLSAGGGAGREMSGPVFGNGMLPMGGEMRPLTGNDNVLFNRQNKLGGATAMKKNKTQLGRRKSDLVGGGSTTFSVKKQQKRDLLKNGGVGGKRKEKKTMTKKRTTSGTAGGPFGGGGGAKLSGVTGVVLLDEKQGLKSWIDNYEKAITNHYSPELRARLQTIGKQQLLMSPVSSVQSIGSGLNVNLKNVGDLSGKCTTVPHAGGKILISTLEVPAHVPIVELRGKYMLSGQYRQHSLLPGAGTGGRNQGNKPPGPFIFFYRMETAELCVDTRTYGNDARFVRRSCRPNAEIVHHLEKGTIHLYIVSLQPIRSSTEITIKHEPHDLLAVSRASAAGASDVPQPTSTVCACGLVKDCLFYNANGGGLVGGQAGIEGGVGGVRAGKRLNGQVQKLRATSTSRGGGGGGGEENTGPMRRSKANMRNSRSTSSSGESSNSLMSPNIANGAPLFSMMNSHVASGMLSPPTPVMPLPTLKGMEVLNNNFAGCNGMLLMPPKEEPEKKPSNLNSLAAEPLMTIIKQELAQQQQHEQEQQQVLVEVKQEPVIPLTAEVKDEIVVVEDEPTTTTTQMQSPVPVFHVSPPKFPVVVKKEEQQQQQEHINNNKLKMEEKIVSLVEVKEEMSSDLQQSLLKSPEIGSTTPQKRNKELKSLSEENLKAAPVSAKAMAEESRKLTREERKMQAIMKAFEKMEKSSMRKQEGRKNSGSCSAEVGAAGKRRDSTSQQQQQQQPRKDSEDRSIFKKKKRKGSKSYQQTTNQRRMRRKSQSLAVDDVFTSEESTGSLLASPPISVPFSYSLPQRPLFDSGKFNGEQNSAANMLLSLANASPAGGVCQLVEAAIAPLEAASDFKMPKTKKSIMNDWLSADKSGGNSPNEKQQSSQPFESLIQAAQTVHGGNEPQNLCKKVEEFIIQTGVDVLREDNNNGAGENIEGRLHIPPPFPTPPLTGGSESAVKKRWLRQAISEECSDEAPASPTNGYAATPLKKRRFALQCSDYPEDLSPSTPKQFVNSCTNSPVEEEVKRIEERVDVEPRRAGSEDDQIDAMNATQECSLAIRDEEMVKIEPEKDVKVNVEEEDERPDEQSPLPVEEPMAEAPMEENVAEAEPEVKEEKVSEPELNEVVFKAEVDEEKTIPEEEKETSTPTEPETIIPEEFDIEPLNPKEELQIVIPPIQDVTRKSAGSGEDASDEIADIQKRLHSFHAENILFLKSMNKKTKPNPSPQNSDCMSAYSSASVSASSSAASSPIASPRSSSTATIEILGRRHSTSTVLSSTSSSSKRKKLDFDAEEVMKDLGTDEIKSSSSMADVNASPEKRKRRTKSRFSSPIPGGIELKDLNSNTVAVLKEGLTVTVTPTPPEPSQSEPMNKSTFKPPEMAATQQATHSYYTTGPSSYVSGSGSGAGHHGMMPGLINTSIPPPHLSYPSMYNAYGAQVDPSPATSSQSFLSELLENAQKISHPFSASLVDSTGAAATTTGVRGAAAPSSLLLLGSPAAQTGFFTLNSSPGLSKMTFNSESPATPTAASRTLIRTASADPRLNPNLNAAPETPPAPKRKLSINEYRKRMQQTSSCGSESNSSSAAASPTGGGSGGASRDPMGDKCGLEEDEAVELATVKSGGEECQLDTMESNILESLCDLKEDDSNSSSPSPSNVDGVAESLQEDKGSLSPNASPSPNLLHWRVPTLLERQQESISERLKSYKSVTELLTTKDGTPIITTILQNNPLGTSIIESLRNTSSAMNRSGSPPLTTTGGEEEKEDNEEKEKDTEMLEEESMENNSGQDKSEDERMETAAAAR